MHNPGGIVYHLYEDGERILTANNQQILNISHGHKLPFVMVPEPGYYVQSISVEPSIGASYAPHDNDIEFQGGEWFYAIAAVNSDTTFRVTFALRPITTHNVTVSHNAGGSVTPGSTTILSNETRTFTITPARNYRIGSVLVNGVAVSLGAASSVTIDGSLAINQTINVTFNRVSSTIGGGTAQSPPPASSEPPPPPPLPPPAPPPETPETPELTTPLQPPVQPPGQQPEQPPEQQPPELPPGQLPEAPDISEPLTPPRLGDVSQLLYTDEHVLFVVGVGEGLFAPDRNLSRAEAATMFFNLLRNQEVAITRSFPDVAESDWFARAVLTLASLGLVSGSPEGTFDPQQPITRAQLVAMAIAFVSEVPLIDAEIYFSDVAKEHWAYQSIKVANHFGWVGGFGDGTFLPDANLTRAQAVTIINRMQGRVADREFIESHPNLLHFTDVTNDHWAYYEIMEAANRHLFVIDETGEHWQE